MAARRTLQFSSTSAKCILSNSTTYSSTSASKVANFNGIFTSRPCSVSRFSLQKLISSRFPVELGGALSLIPLHSVTASALFTSLLTLHNDKWGCLSEGFATPL
ncbi:hypothetical protein K2173_008258 [Erythroxylum novogranatense]|uniref:Protein NUCLEAR FUSION DEFECTIVE 6, chloroplastic/mitochondrial-like n=1 Tax=Erythroxylum novogranatense TaxID=1862640 RepID=A0AAV8U641_9ROSI|nr:hypothetical protein K2173_008258 [Erythroxylum novogranatense]